MTKQIVLPDVAALADRAAEEILHRATLAVAAHGSFSIALSGGSTPRALFARLAEEPYRTAMPWEQTHIFWSDERLVPPDDEESNYRMAAETLLAFVHIPAANIYLTPTIGSTPEHAAQSYEETIRAVVGGEPPAFDVVLLGMGPDGHTASLFPGQSAVTTPDDALVVAVYNAPKMPPERISFSYRLINAARLVLVLVAGADKAETVRRVFRDAPDPAALPMQGVQPAGELLWLLDQAAAGAAGAS